MLIFLFFGLVVFGISAASVCMIFAFPFTFTQFNTVKMSTATRKVILDLTTSLDGFIEGPNREIDWIIMEKDLGVYLNNFAKEIDTVFYGRTSYELYGHYVPDTDKGDGLTEFYTSVNKLKKYVFSHTLQPNDIPDTVISGDIAEAVQQIKKQPGKDIWLFGGSSLLTSFINLNLVDEYRISLQPVILGAGNPLFKDIQSRVPLRLIKTDTSASGVVALYYQPA